MKTLVIMLAVLFSFGAASAEDEGLKSICPKTRMGNSCLDCHVKGDFRVRETRPDAHLIYPNEKMRVLGWEDGKLYGYYLLEGIESDPLYAFFRYLRRHNINRAVIEVHSPGGGLFDAQRIVSIMDEWRSQGGTIETRLHGICASAGFYIFVSGDKGKRLVYPYSDLMWHEIRAVEGWGGPRLVMPANKEDEAKVFRHLQDMRNEYLATRGNLTKEQLDERIRYRDWWMSGRQAVEFGFADGFLGR